MKDCCEVSADLSRRQRHVFRIVLVVNVLMFVTELVVGLLAHSTALVADSVDMLGDAIVYGFSLYVVGRAEVWKVRAALLKGALMALFAGVVVAEVLIKLATGTVPSAHAIGVVGLLALAANGSVLWLLWRHRADDVNMQSAWLCSRNDVLGNVGVLAAAVGVGLTGSVWPDIAVGLLLAAVFGSAAVTVIRSARRAGISPLPA